MDKQKCLQLVLDHVNTKARRPDQTYLFVCKRHGLLFIQWDGREWQYEWMPKAICIEEITRKLNPSPFKTIKNDKSSS